MKVIPLYLLIILLVSCKKNDGPTIFEGKVVFQDDESAYNQGYVFIEGFRGFVNSTVSGHKANILDGGKFKIEIQARENISYYHLKLSTGGSQTFSEDSGLDCSPIDCDKFQPGKKYTDLVIRVPGVEE